MQNRNGFTLVEMLFSLFIITVLSVFSLSIGNSKVGNNEIKEIFVEIKSIIEEARVLALSTHTVVSLDISNNSIGYQTGTKNRKLELTKGMTFSHIKNIYFNENGTINQGNHIVIGTKEITNKIIFTVGSGDFYLQQ